MFDCFAKPYAWVDDNVFTADACSESQVKVNDVYAKATKMISVGDVVYAMTTAGKRQYEVVGLADERGSTSASETLFRDTTPADWNKRPERDADDIDDGYQKNKRGRKRDRRAQRKLKYR